MVLTAQNANDIGDMIDLRRAAFSDTFVVENNQLDQFDEFDYSADFLLIRKNGILVASYRILCSAYTESFYSASEFMIDDWLRSPGRKIELSRACVLKAARSSIALHMLWRGLALYIKKSKACCLFGCSSAATVQLHEILNIYQELKELGCLDESHSVLPNAQGSMLNPEFFKQAADSKSSQSDCLPPLLRTYIAAGATVAPIPSVDLKFHCVDFFTVLDMNHLDQKFANKYFG